MTFKFIILTFSLISFSLSAKTFSCIESTQIEQQSCESTTSRNEIQRIVKALIYSDNETLEQISGDQYVLEDQFSELIQSYEENKILFREFENNEYYLKTMFKLTHILKKDRKMYLDLNIKLYECSPSKSALISIMAHELKHLLDYKKSVFFKVSKLGLRMLFKKSRSKYERETDLFVMKNGLSSGLIQYREWIYNQLDEKSLKTKECFYYTPKEIELYLNQDIDSMDTYFSNYCR